MSIRCAAQSTSGNITASWILGAALASSRRCSRRWSPRLGGGSRRSTCVRQRRETRQRSPTPASANLSAMYSIATQEVAWPGRGFDLILINSVVQYMAPEEVWQWLHQWHAMLASGGRVVLSDLIPPRHSSLSDIACLLRLGSRQRSALVAANQALGGVGSYWRTRHARPLTAISKADLARHAAAARFDVTFLPANLTHFRQRWAAILHSPT